MGFPQALAESSSWLYVNQVADFFVDISQFYIALPHANEFQRLSVPLLGRQAVLFIDGMIQPIQRPSHAGDVFFCGRKGKQCDSLNIQIVSDRFGVIRHIVAGVPGSSHDSVAIRQSPWFMRYLAALPQPYVVVGDIAYIGLSPNLMTPHRKPRGRNLSPQERQENKLISSKRILAERVNNCLEVKWRMNQQKENRLPALKGPDFAAKCMIAAAVLHNRFTNFI